MLYRDAPRFSFPGFYCSDVPGLSSAIHQSFMETSREPHGLSVPLQPCLPPRARSPRKGPGQCHTAPSRLDIHLLLKIYGEACTAGPVAKPLLATRFKELAGLIQHLDILVTPRTRVLIRRLLSIISPAPHLSMLVSLTLDLPSPADLSIASSFFVGTLTSVDLSVSFSPDPYGGTPLWPAEHTQLLCDAI